jgi:3-deoxy-D-manno-octulosonate 8-phosphate phosphatase (KDO 8-P phosphatase)
MTQSTADRAKLIRLAVFDVDGVLTDGSLYMNEAGEEIKAFNTLDGHGLKMLQHSGVELAIITGRTSRSVEMRAKNLGIKHLYQGVENKLETLTKLLAALKLEASSAMFMGDDVVDLPAMRHCGFAVCVPAAPAIVKKHSHFVAISEGGRGAVREVCEFIMQTQGTLDKQLEKYLA